MQWKSGAAAWLGWLFDGLDMILYTLVAIPFVAELLACGPKRSAASATTAPGFRRRFLSAGRWEAASLAGWAIGSVAAGRLMLTILTYALFTGLSFFAQTWWQLLIFRFLAALGHRRRMGCRRGADLRNLAPQLAPLAGGDFANGREPGHAAGRRWSCFFMAGFAARDGSFWSAFCRPCWCCGFAGPCPSPKNGMRPSVVPRESSRESSTCFAAGSQDDAVDARGLRLVAQRPLGVHLLVFAAFLRNLPDVAGWTDAERSQFVGQAITLVMVSSIVGNFLAAAMARRHRLSMDDRGDVPGLLRFDAASPTARSRAGRTRFGAWP